MDEEEEGILDRGNKVWKIIVFYNSMACSEHPKESGVVGIKGI